MSKTIDSIIISNHKYYSGYIVFLYKIYVTYVYTVFYMKTLIYSNLAWSEVFYAETSKNSIQYYTE